MLYINDKSGRLYISRQFEGYLEHTLPQMSLDDYSTKCVAWGEAYDIYGDSMSSRGSKEYMGSSYCSSK